MSGSSGMDRRVGRAWNDHEGGSMWMRADTRFGADHLPPGWWFGRVSAVVGDETGEVYVAHRGPAGDPIVVLDAGGHYVRSWGRDLLRVPHGLRMDPSGDLWVTDVDRHQVYRFDREGRLLLTLGTADIKGCDERTFNLPTDIGFGPDGDIYVSDGYGNCRVVRFTADGSYRGTWGQRGTGPGDFDTPHSVALGHDGLLYVSDRHNHRIVVFTLDGAVVREWDHLGATQCITFGPGGRLWVMTYRNVPELLAQDSLGGRLMELDPTDGRVLASLEANAHWVHAQPSGDLFLACLAGSVTRLWPGWVDLAEPMDEREHLQPPDRSGTAG